MVKIHGYRKHTANIYYLRYAGHRFSRLGSRWTTRTVTYYIIHATFVVVPNGTKCKWNPKNRKTRKRNDFFVFENPTKLAKIYTYSNFDLWLNETDVVYIVCLRGVIILSRKENCRSAADFRNLTLFENQLSTETSNTF